MAWARRIPGTGIYLSFGRNRFGDSEVSVGRTHRYPDRSLIAAGPPQVDITWLGHAVPPGAEYIGGAAHLWYRRLLVVIRP